MLRSTLSREAENMKLTCATYNILRGHNSKEILENILFLAAEGADVICLQEAEKPFEAQLRKILHHDALRTWEARFAHAGQNGDVATLWNAQKLDLKKADIVVLPKMRILRSLRMERMARRWNRLAIVTEFDVAGGVLQVTNAHLAWEGGSRHRMYQLRHLRAAIMATPAEYRIVAGDFNTVAMRPMRRLHERRVEKVLGEEFRNAFPRLPWTFDLSNIPQPPGARVTATLARAGLRWRQRFDYMFSSGMHMLQGRMHDLPGSDHRPLIATFSLLPVKQGLQLSDSN